MLHSVSRAAAACAIIIVVSSAAPAQISAPETTVAIDLPEALSRTLARNPALRAEGFATAAAEGILLQATYRPNPELSVVVEDALGTSQYSGLRSSEATVSLAWILERGVRQHIVAAARAGVDVSSIEIEIAQLDAAAETARRFVDCLLYQGRYRRAEIGVERAREAAAAVRRRVESGRAPAAELGRAEAELARAELRLDDFQHELLSAYHRLAAQWGTTEPDFGSVAGNLTRMPPVQSFESLLSRVERNPDLSQFVSQARLADAELSLARARSRPSWRLSGGLRRVEFSDDWALVGGITIPLRLGNRNQGRIAEAQANRDRVEAAAEAARVRVRTEIFVLYQELLHNVELAERLETDIAPKYETALADMQRAFELGRSSYLEYRAVQTELLDVAYDTLDAHATAFRLAIEIERLTGESLAATPSRE